MTLKVSLPPFVHSQYGERIFHRDLVLSVCPAAVYIFLMRMPESILILTVFIVSEYLIDFIRNSFVSRRIDLNRSLYWGLAAMLILPVDRLDWRLPFVIFLSVFLYRFFLGSGKRTVFPPFVLLFVFTALYYRMDFGLYGYQVLILSCIGIGYLIVKRDLSILFVLSFTAFIILKYITNGTGFQPPGIYGIVLLLFGWPGLMPVNRLGRLISGFLTALIITVYGVWGLPAVLLLTPVMEMF